MGPRPLPTNVASRVLRVASASERLSDRHPQVLVIGHFADVAQDVIHLHALNKLRNQQSMEIENRILAEVDKIKKIG